jgi:hypothetical protein
VAIGGVVAIILGGMILTAAAGPEIRLAPGSRDIWSDKSRFDVCAACIPTGQATETNRTHGRPTFWNGALCQWWVAATPGSKLHRELLGAQTVLFELDPGSGLGDACRSEEAAVGEARARVVSGVIERCPSIPRFIILSGGHDKQVVFPIYDVGDERCVGLPPRP